MGVVEMSAIDFGSQWRAPKGPTKLSIMAQCTGAFLRLANYIKLLP